MHRRVRTHRGMTLVESLLALALLGGVLLGAAWVIQTARLDVEESRRRGLALREAWSLLDRTAAADRVAWGDLAGGGRCGLSSSSCAVESGAAAPGTPLWAWHRRLAETLPAGSGRLELAALDGTLAEARLVRARVEVRWRGRQRPRRLVLTGALR